MIQVYLLILTSDHQCLVDFDPQKIKGQIPAFEIKNELDILKQTKDFFLQTYDISYQKFLGAHDDGQTKVLIFHFEEPYSQKKMKLQGLPLSQAFLLSAKHHDLFWQAYEKILLKGYHLPSWEDVQVWAFGHSKEESSYLASLVISGQKKTSSSLFWSYDYDEDPIPKVGNLSVVLDFSGSPIAILSTKEVKILPFHMLSQDIMKEQGDEQLSFDVWRKNLWDYFAEECDSMGLEPDENMPIVLETFDVLHSLIAW